MIVSGEDIPAAALIESISSSTAFTMTEEATASASAPLTFTTADGVCYYKTTAECCPSSLCYDTLSGTALL